VLIRFDPGIISLNILIEVHLRTHSTNSGYTPNGRYRSAVYVRDANQQRRTGAAITRLGKEVDTAARTKVPMIVGFRSSEERYRNYYRTVATRPFCRRYIDPKLVAIRRDVAWHVLSESDVA
jgi:peptide-methionine (S)-S-oxide reductase